MNSPLPVDITKLYFQIMLHSQLIINNFLHVGITGSPNEKGVFNSIETTYDPCCLIECPNMVNEASPQEARPHSTDC